MGAFINRAEKRFFILDKKTVGFGGKPIGSHAFFPDFSISKILGEPRRDTERLTWLVCPHLSKRKMVYEYYRNSGLIMVVLGKCMCEACYDMVISVDDLSEWVKVSRPMTDESFQEQFISPLVSCNQEYFVAGGHAHHSDQRQWSWISCSHLAKTDGLFNIYTGCEPIFFYEGCVTCNDCIDINPSGSSVNKLIMDCEPMTDFQFQERIINPLYPMNLDVLEAIGHFSMS